jgi:transcriptional regulator with XRE-family HTH domain
VLYLTDVLEAQGRKQRWLARRLGIHESLLSKYIYGVRPVPPGVERRAAELLDLPATVPLFFTRVVPSGTYDEPRGTSDVAEPIPA